VVRWKLLDEISETRTGAYIDGIWYTIARNRMTYNEQGKRITSENLAGQVTTTAWDQFACTPVGELIPAAKNAKSAKPASAFDDGNQTLVKTATGIWSVTYNGENRPILWECVSTNSPTPNSSTPTLISMSYDRMGRRVTKNNQRFVYDGYLRIANFEHQTSNFKLQTFIWDSTEPIATRPLVWNYGPSSAYYAHDGNKNVSEVIAANGDVSAHYEYAPFGAVTASVGASSAANPWRFSSEYAEDDTATVYYNYRHYNPLEGRWTSRDFVDERIWDDNTYLFLANVLGDFDVLGLRRSVQWQDFWKKMKAILKKRKYSKEQQQWAESQLARGCVGITTSLLGTKERFDNCYKTLSLAMKRRDEMKQLKICKQGCPYVYSIHFWNDKGVDKKNPDVTFDVSGKADMSNWDKAPRPSDINGNYFNFDFGFYHVRKREIVHANHYHNPDVDGDGKGDYYPRMPVTEATIYFSNLKEWAESYQDFNAEVWCVQCSQRGGNYAH